MSGRHPDGSAVRLEATVVGRVQGVGFRFFARDAAIGRGLVGWVANDIDGSVHCVAEGPLEALEALVGDLERGPLGGQVDAVRVVWQPASGTFERFAIRSGAHSGD
ncbi:MAG: acylphosphatase [Chloroflexi bacterium]|nr:acylphosphatase [Chloroflexota bacterium]